MSRVEQVNENLQREVAKFINNELNFNEVLVTVSRVDCSPDLKNAKIFISVLPDNKFGSTIERLKKNTSPLTSYLKKNIKLRVIPKISWQVDPTEKEASVIDGILRQIEEE